MKTLNNLIFRFRLNMLGRNNPRIVYRVRIFHRKFLRSFFQKATEFPKARSLWSHTAVCEIPWRSKNAGRVNCAESTRGKPSSGVSIELKQKQMLLHLLKAQSALIAAKRLVLIYNKSKRSTRSVFLL